jgi:hypothetical protein
MPESSEKAVAKANDLARRAARKAGKNTPGLHFTEDLGGGKHGRVYEAEMTAPVPVLSKDCARGGTNLMQVDLHPAVKVSVENRTNAIVRGAREYELARWAHRIGIGPAVHCQATWDLGSKDVYHLIFMEKMFANLLRLSNDHATPLETKQLAWAWAFQQIGLVSKAKPPSIGIDLKPENLLVADDKNQNLEGIYIADWDPFFWKSVPNADEALLFNYLTMVSNSLFPVGSILDFCEQIPNQVRAFASRLTSEWSKTPGFRKYLLRWDRQFLKGIYHYALNLGASENKALKFGKPEKRADAYVKALQVLGSHYGSFSCGHGLDVPGGSAAKATKIAAKRFT